MEISFSRTLPGVATVERTASLCSVPVAITKHRGRHVRFTLGAIRSASTADHDRVIRTLLTIDPDAVVRTARAVYEGLTDFETQVRGRQ